MREDKGNESHDWRDCREKVFFEFLLVKGHHHIATVCDWRPALTWHGWNEKQSSEEGAFWLEVKGIPPGAWQIAGTMRDDILAAP